jgi:hypothetical protein
MLRGFLRAWDCARKPDLPLRKGKCVHLSSCSGSPRPRFEQAFLDAVHPLRILHSGQAGEYVAWLTVGVAVFGAFFAGLLL